MNTTMLSRVPCFIEEKGDAEQEPGHSRSYSGAYPRGPRVNICSVRFFWFSGSYSSIVFLFSHSGQGPGTDPSGHSLNGSKRDAHSHVWSVSGVSR